MSAKMFDDGHIHTLDEMRIAIASLHGLDDEAAHAREDWIHYEALRHIAEGGDDAKEMAALAITTMDLDFERWCA